jgi:hypothetical protein
MFSASRRKQQESCIMDAQLLHATLKRFRGSFLAFFPALTTQDYQTLLAGEGETLLDLLGRRYGCTRGEARSAWNEFVLRHVDGRDLCHTRVRAAPGMARKNRCKQSRPQASA